METARQRRLSPGYLEAALRRATLQLQVWQTITWGTGTATHEDLQATVDELIPLVDGEIDDLAALTPLKNWQVAADAALINERELVPAPFAEWPTRNCPL